MTDHPALSAWLDHHNDPVTETVDLDGPETARLAVNYAGRSWLFIFSTATDPETGTAYQWADVRLFDDRARADVVACHAGTLAANTSAAGLSSPVGVFAMARGRRFTLDAPRALGGEPEARSHGWPAAPLVVLLADDQPEPVGACPTCEALCDRTTDHGAPVGRCRGCGALWTLDRP